MPNIKLSDGRWLAPRHLCTACKDGEYVLYTTELDRKIKPMEVVQVYNCDKCGATSVRRYTK